MTAANDLPQRLGKTTLMGEWDASLAQLVEQRFRKAWVAGSNPATGSSSYSTTYTESSLPKITFYLR
jgi:hypothetical protein